MTLTEELLDRLSRTVTAIGAQTDPLVRARLALQAYDIARGPVASALADERRRAVRELRATGYSLKEVAELLGITDSRVAQITGA